MNIIESVEYYSSCPQCGAASGGVEVCEYCGGSLVKRRVNQSIGNNNTNIEDANMMEDAGLREITGKIREKDSFLILFSVVFGGCFTLVPIIIGIAFTSTGIMEPWVFLMMGMFLLVGIGSFIPLIISIKDGIKCKTGEPVSGIVRGYSNGLATINNRPVLNIRLLMNINGESVILELGTGKTQREFKLGTTVYLKKYKNSYIYDKEKMNML